MLEFEALISIRVHNWDGKNQGDEVRGSNNAVCPQSFEVS